MFHLLAYRVTAAVNDANVDMTALVDSEFSSRNNHYIFSEDYVLFGAHHLGANVLRCRTNVPTLNALFRHHIWPVNRSATPLSHPRIADYRDLPIHLPMSEEIALEESGNLGAATEEETTHLWIAPRRFRRDIPRGEPMMTARFTAAVTRTAATWSGGANITFEQTLRGGWYGVVGAWVQSTLCRAFRFIFPRTTTTDQGRKLRPGTYVTNAVGNIEAPGWNDQLGLWGMFHTFEPPQMEVHADAAGADTQEGRMELVYLGDRDYSSPPSFGF